MSSGTLFLYNVIGWLTTTIMVYLIIHLVLWMFNKKASVIRKLIFAIIVGPIFDEAWTRLIFYGFKINFLSPLAPVLHTLPIPLLALLCCFLGVKLLKIPKIKAPRIMTVYYLSYLIIIRFIKSLLFLQTFSNDMASIYTLITFLIPLITIIVLALLNLFASKIFKNLKTITVANEEFFFSPKKDIGIYIINSIIVYALTVIMNFAMKSSSLTNLASAVVIGLFLVTYILMDYKKTLEVDNENKVVHIKMLRDGNNKFGLVKHDFYNVLQTYDGYLILGDIEKLRKYHSNLMHVTLSAGTSMELGMKMEQNPVLVSLLSNKAEYAEKVGVRMRITMLASLENFNISDIDLSRSLSCLIDNAIEAAVESENKTVHFSVEQKAGGGRLVIITNSTAGPVDIEKSFSLGETTKEGHSGLGLVGVKRIFEKYPHCIFKMSYYNFEVNAYIDIQDI